MDLQPVILLTFSNDEDAYLSKIVAEQKAIKKALLDFADNNYIHLRDVQRTSTEEVFYLINRYHNRVHILHYGGHASGTALQLEREIGVVQSADVKGVAGLLGTQRSLKVVFLNGCATKGQVKQLLASGVPAVIATSVPIQDDAAQRFAAQFYQALASGSTLREAFLKTKALLDSDSQAREILPPDETRGPQFQSMPENVTLPWGLYWKEGSEAVLDWKLPTVSPLELDFSGGQFDEGQKAPGINQTLVNRTLKAVQHGWAVQELAQKIKLERVRKKDKSIKATDAQRKEAILRSYPAPISLHLRTLFSKGLARQWNEARLLELTLAFRRTFEFLSMVILSGLWDAATQRDEPFQLEPEERRQLEAFFSLNALSAPGFDFFAFGSALLEVAKRNEVELFLKELQGFQPGWRHHKEGATLSLGEAHTFFAQMDTALESDIPARLIEPYCRSAESHLCDVLVAFHFLHPYRMAVIKRIEVHQVRNTPPTVYKHAMVELDNSQNDIGHKDQWQDLNQPTDMESVLVYQDGLDNHLNLSPFILDKNALIRELNFKIYFFAHRTEQGLNFAWVENADDTLLINPRQYGYVLDLFEKARRDVLGLGQATITRETQDNDDDILGL